MDDDDLTDEQRARFAADAAKLARDLQRLARSMQDFRSAASMLLLDAIEAGRAGRTTREGEIAEALVARHAAH